MQGGQQQRQKAASNLLEPPADGASRRKSSLSANGFFIDHSCTRRRSSAMKDQQQQQHQLHPFPLLAYATGSSGYNQPSSGSYANTAASSQPSSPSRALSRASCSQALSGFQVGAACQTASAHLSPLQAPLALAGSRKTSIFDPAGHSLLPPPAALGCHQQRLAPSATSASNAVPIDRRRRSTMTASAAAAVAAAAPCHARLAAAAKQAAHQHHGGRGAATVGSQLVPVIGCSPTSIQASLAALDESRRYEKLLRGLERRQERKERRRRRRLRELQDADAAASGAAGQPRRKSLRTIRDALPLVGAKRRRRETGALTAGSRRRGDDGGQENRSDGSNSESNSMYNGDEEEDDDEDADEDDEEDELSLSDMSFASSRASLPSLDRLAVHFRRRHSRTPPAPIETAAPPTPPLGETTGARRLSARRSVGSAIRRLASSVVGSGQQQQQQHRSSRSASRSVSMSGGLNYWHYYNYLRENSLDQSGALDDLWLEGGGASMSGCDPLGVANGDSGGASSIGGALSEQERRQRQLVNRSLARLEIVNARGQQAPLDGVEVARRLAGQLASGRGQEAARLLDDLFNQSSTDNDELASLSTSSSRPHSPTPPSSPSRRSQSQSQSQSQAANQQQQQRPCCPHSAASSSCSLSTNGGASAPQLSPTSRSRLPSASAESRPAAARLTGWRSSASFAPTDADADEPLDDFDRLNRCHRGYKPPAPAEPQPPPLKSRDPSLRLSMRSTRSGARHAHRRAGAPLDPSNPHAPSISMSWDTLNTFQQEQAQPAASSGRQGGLGAWLAAAASWRPPRARQASQPKQSDVAQQGKLAAKDKEKDRDKDRSKLAAACSKARSQLSIAHLCADEHQAAAGAARDQQAAALPVPREPGDWKARSGSLRVPRRATPTGSCPAYVRAGCRWEAGGTATMTATTNMTTMATTATLAATTTTFGAARATSQVLPRMQAKEEELTWAARDRDRDKDKAASETLAPEGCERADQEGRGCLAMRTRAHSAGTRPPATMRLLESSAASSPRGQASWSQTSLSSGGCCDQRPVTGQVGRQIGPHQQQQPTPRKASREKEDQGEDQEEARKGREPKHFTCVVVGARQVGKRTIVRCFVKLLNEFKLAAAEYRKERLLAKLADCQEHLREILERSQTEADAAAAEASAHRHRRASRLNSWLGGRAPSSLNRLLGGGGGSGGSAQTAAGKPRLNSVCVTAPATAAASQVRHDPQRRHTAIAHHHHQLHQQQLQREQPEQDNRFLRVHSPSQPPPATSNSAQHLNQTKLHQTNRSDSNINYHCRSNRRPSSSPRGDSADEEETLQLQVPLRWPGSNSADSSRRNTRLLSSVGISGAGYDEEPMENTREDPRSRLPMTRRELKSLISLRELNKRRVRIKFRTRRELSDRLLAATTTQSQTTSMSSNEGCGGGQARANSRRRHPDAFLVVYSINNRDSFEYSKSLLAQLSRLREQRTLPVVLVANKIDLERAKVIKSEEGRAAARKNGCKFIEISCTVGFNLDNLLVGLRMQLVLKHHLALNSLLRQQTTAKHSSKPAVKAAASKTEQAGDSSGRQQGAGSRRHKRSGLLMRFYRRYVADNHEARNFDCDNFSKL